MKTYNLKLTTYGHLTYGHLLSSTTEMACNGNRSPKYKELQREVERQLEAQD
jgi:hypothetical protein